MKESRPDIIERLIGKLLERLELEAVREQATGDEIVSAIMTIATRTVAACCNKDALRPTIERMWAQLGDEDLPHA